MRHFLLRENTYPDVKLGVSMRLLIVKAFNQGFAHLVSTLIVKCIFEVCLIATITLAA